MGSQCGYLCVPGGNPTTRDHLVKFLVEVMHMAQGHALQQRWQSAMRKFSDELAWVLGEISSKELPVSLCCAGKNYSSWAVLGRLHRCCTAINPGSTECVCTWSQRQFITGLEIEFQCFNHKTSPPTCLPLFLKSK